jgi:hypothetical protein
MALSPLQSPTESDDFSENRCRGLKSKLTTTTCDCKSQIKSLAITAKFFLLVLKSEKRKKLSLTRDKGILLLDCRHIFW